MARGIATMAVVDPRAADAGIVTVPATGDGVDPAPAPGPGDVPGTSGADGVTGTVVVPAARGVAAGPLPASGPGAGQPTGTGVDAGAVGALDVPDAAGGSDVADGGEVATGPDAPAGAGVRSRAGGVPVTSSEDAPVTPAVGIPVTSPEEAPATPPVGIPIGGPVPRVEPHTAPTPVPGAVDVAEAEEFLRLFHHEDDGAGDPADRIAAVRDEIARTGTYVHTPAELAFGARVAWRNSARCIGRLYWRSLHVRDRRHVTAPADVADECVGHLREATRRGRIRSTITVFAPDTPTTTGPRVWNEQLIRYAGYRTGGRVLGDPRLVGFTDTARALGWVPPSPMGRFDVLPLVVSGGAEHAAEGPQWFDVPSDAVLEVPLTHPDHAWFADLGLRWHALPVISNMKLDIGGVSYGAAPFNGWYMATEIGARNLADADRYDLLPDIAARLGLDTSSERTMWRDRAVVELTLAVQSSFDAAGVSVADHHGESQRFLRHVEREETAGRHCPVDWSWIVPPISGGLTPVFHRYYDEPTDTGPMFRVDPTSKARGQGCPV